MHLFNFLVIHSHRRGRAASLGALLAVLALLASACGDGGDVQIVAITRTPGPSATPDATVDGGASTDTPGTDVTPSVEVPERPDNPLAGGLAVAAYLAGGAADIEHCLPGLVSAWRLVPTEGERCATADFDADGKDEFVFVLTLGVDGEEPSGDVWLFDDADAGYRLVSSARVLANDLLERVVLHAAADLTGDRAPELVITAEDCAGDLCTTRLLIASSHRGSLQDLAPGDLQLATVEDLTIEDVTDDGLADIVMEGSEAAAVPGAGPPRASRIVLSWAGLRFFDREEQEAPRYLFHAIVDADAAYARGELADARDMYRAAAVDTALVDWRAEQGQGSGRGELVTYAWLRAGVASVRLGDRDAAIGDLDRAVGEFPGTLHAQAAAVYREALVANLSPSLACQTVEQYLQPQSSTFARIWDYGVANPEHHINELCR